MGHTSKLKLSWHQRIIAWQLAEGRFVSIEEIVAALYEHRADGGPLTADNCARGLLHKVRGKLAAHGVPIENKLRSGWRVAPLICETLRNLLADEIARNAPRHIDRRKSPSATNKAVDEELRA